VLTGEKFQFMVLDQGARELGRKEQKGRKGIPLVRRKTLPSVTASCQPLFLETNFQKFDLARGRTWNLLIRSQTLCH
jgi:hypothetical protein